MANAPLSLEGKNLFGQMADIAPTAAKVLSRFSTGRPLLLQNSVGKGSVSVLNFEAGRQCFQAGNGPVEAAIAAQCSQGHVPDFTATGTANVFRRSSPLADHFFLVATAAGTTTITLAKPTNYTTAQDAITTQPIPIAPNGRITIPLQAGTGRWLTIRKR